MASAALRARLWIDAEDLALVEARGAVVLHVDDELDASPRELAPRAASRTSSKNFCRYTLRDEDALLAARELEDLALHRADVIELLQR